MFPNHIFLRQACLKKKTKIPKKQKKTHDGTFSRLRLAETRLTGRNKMSSFSHGSKADVTALHRDGNGDPSTLCVRASVSGPHSTVACTTISGSSMSFLLWTILSSS